MDETKYLELRDRLDRYNAIRQMIGQLDIARDHIIAIGKDEIVHLRRDIAGAPLIYLHGVLFEPLAGPMLELLAKRRAELVVERENL